MKLVGIIGSATPPGRLLGASLAKRVVPQISLPGVAMGDASRLDGEYDPRCLHRLGSEHDG